MDVGCSLSLLAASTMTTLCHSDSSPIIQLTKTSPSTLHCYSVMVPLYAHPQHIKVLKLFVYPQYGCGMW